MFVENLILGGGLAGISTSYHLGHQKCLILEKNPNLFGLLATRKRNGFTWDNGPHVSFTKHEYVRSLFAHSTQNQFHEIPVNVGNYSHGSWIRHPAQVNLAQIPEPLRSKCVADIEKTLTSTPTDSPLNYQQWLEASLGKVFTENFSAPYTRKYWTVEPSSMSCDWVGSRVHRPKLEDVLAGAKENLQRNLHYINKIRYPKTGGYQTFANFLSTGANAQLNTRAILVDLVKKEVRTNTGETFQYNHLISTIPLPEFVSICAQSTPAMRAAAKELLCSSVYLVDVELSSPTNRPEHWFYIYNENFISTRIHFVEKLSPQNTPTTPQARGGVQVEVYHSAQKPIPVSEKEIIPQVLKELEQMGILKTSEISADAAHLTPIPNANIVFLRDTAERLNTLWDAFTPFGLERENDDIHPITIWDENSANTPFNPSTPPPTSNSLPPLLMAGRFGQWKYFWTDDSVLCGKSIATRIQNS